MNLSVEQGVKIGGPARVALAEHPTRSATTIDGWRAALFGIPFFAGGIWVILGALGVIRSVSYAPAWVITLIGALFFFAGLFLLLHGLRGIMAKARYARGAAQHHGQIWLYDFNWRQDGITYSAYKAMLARLLAALVWTAILVPMFWFALSFHGAWLYLIAVPALFSVAGIVFWYRWAVRLVDSLRHGNTHLRYDSFPYFLGGTLRARLSTPHHVADLDSLTLALRCVQEQYITFGSGEDRSSSVACYELYKDVVTFTRDHLAGFAGGEVPVEFCLPPDQPGTSLASTPPLYWEIEAGGSSRLVNYQAYFLVPVYKPWI